MGKTFSSFSFGCRVNAAEMEALDRQLQLLGFERNDKNPDIYIINTCAVTKKAEREARQMIYQLKRKLPKSNIVVTGCAATKWMNENQKSNNDLLIDNPNKEYVAQILVKKFKNKITSSKLQVPNKSKITNSKYLDSGRLLLKIQDGCQRFCTFCIVPYLRGQPKSVRIKDIESRIKDYENEIKEVILTAINTQAYGYDSGESFIDLVSMLIDKTRVERISFGSIHPWSVTQEFLKFYKKIRPKKRLVDFFHIPLQSGSDKILKLMRRGYTRQEFVEKLTEIKNIYPDAFIGTDVIVGFLEETDQDFEDTYNFLKDSPISKFHVFRFSPREKTAAYFMKKRVKSVAADIKKKRAKALIDLSTQKYLQFQQSLVGKNFDALFLEQKTKGFRQALLSNQVPIFVKANRDLVGKIRQVKVTGFSDNKLLGIV